MDKTEWIICPVCKSKTRVKIREDTELVNFPLFCPKCKQESLVNVKQLNMRCVLATHPMQETRCKNGDDDNEQQCDQSRLAAMPYLLP